MRGHSHSRSGLAVALLWGVIGTAIPCPSAQPPQMRLWEIPSKRPQTVGDKDPIARVESGGHAGEILDLSVDAEGRLALTLGSDDTARLWELPSGRLLRTFRPPSLVRNSDDNSIEPYRPTACALSPNGRTVAVGGGYPDFDGLDAEKRVYLFDAVTGKLLRDPIRVSFYGVGAMAFSRGGRFLAVASATVGLLIYDTKTWSVMDDMHREFFEGRLSEQGYFRFIRLDWDRDERLAITGRGTDVRVYSIKDQKVKRVAKLEAVRGGEFPFDARFSPDGTKIAVSFYNSSAVTVLNSTTLKRESVSTPIQSTHAQSGEYTPSPVVWSLDGTRLITGDMRRNKNQSLLRYWTQPNLRVEREIPLEIREVTRMYSSPTGVIFAAPTGLGIISEGRERTLTRSYNYNWRWTFGSFQLSNDGSKVSFALDPLGGELGYFEIGNFELGSGLMKKATPFNLKKLHRPKTKGLAIKGWCDEIDASGIQRLIAQGLTKADFAHYANTSMGGSFFELATGDQDQKNRCLAIAQDRSFFLVGTQMTLFCSGSELKDGGWEIPISDGVWAVNTSTDGQLAVAACGDGTIRWYRVDSGRELLRLFPHNDGRRWVVWTPEGYFDCSGDGEDLVGWQLNRGNNNSADFVSASRLRNVYYRPDVIHRVLHTRNTAIALRQANRARNLRTGRPEELRSIIARLRPPSLELLADNPFGRVTLPTDASEVRVRYKIRQSDREPATRVSIRFNGRLVDAVAPLPQGDEIAELAVPLPVGMEGELALFVEHSLSISEATVLRITRETNGATSRQPNLYVIAVGVGDLKMNDAADSDGDACVTQDELDNSRYSKKGDAVLPDLKHAATDAERLCEVLANQRGRLFGEVAAQTLTDSNASTAALGKALTDISHSARPEDVALIYFSGHGGIDKEAGYYLATYDVDPRNVKATAFTAQQISSLLDNIKARTILVLDTCHASGIFGGTRLSKVVASPTDLTGLVNTLSSAEHGVIVMSSSSVKGSAIEDPMKGGLFTRALCEGLTTKKPPVGSGEDGGQPITCLGLKDWLSRRLPELVSTTREGYDDSDIPDQTPVCIIPKGVPDIALALP